MHTHQKHAALARPAYGHFARLEWAFLGAPCGLIQQLAHGLIQRLAPGRTLAYVDADHAGADAHAQMPEAMTHGAHTVFTDKIGFHRLDIRTAPNTFLHRQWFNDHDAVLVNGNHFEAARQVVLIHPAKEDSLRRKLARLTDVRLILLAPGVEAPFPFLLAHLKGASGIPVLPLTDVDAVAQHLRSEMEAARAPVHGLVLAGGRSQRMGADKGLLDYHGRPQRLHVADMLAPHCAETYISCRPDQVEALAAGPYPALPDTVSGLGPFGAILSAFRHCPDCAWLVVACDLPLLDEATLAQLCTQRQPSKVATAFIGQDRDFPEPLITIWEPRSYPWLLQFLAQGYSCPRKVLLNTDVALLQPTHTDALTNANTPEEKAYIEHRIGK